MNVYANVLRKRLGERLRKRLLKRLRERLHKCDIVVSIFGGVGMHAVKLGQTFLSKCDI